MPKRDLAAVPDDVEAPPGEEGGIDTELLAWLTAALLDRAAEVLSGATSPDLWEPPEPCEPHLWMAAVSSVALVAHIGGLTPAHLLAALAEAGTASSEPTSTEQGEPE